MHLAFVCAILYVIYQIIKEKTEKPMPPGARIDHDKVTKDVLNGVSLSERKRRLRCGEYWTFEPKYIPQIDEVVDVERYEYDKERYGKAHAEYRRKSGQYRYKREFDRK